MTIIVKNYDGSLKIPKDLFIRNGSNIDRVKELWINDNGTLRYIYGGNVTNYTGNHPYWTTSLNSGFNLQDGAVPCWNTFWSNNNAGTYSLTSAGTGSIQVQIPLAAITSTDIPGTPGSPGYYIPTTETRNILCNFTQGSTEVVTFVDPGVRPRFRTGADGVQVPWNIFAAGSAPDGNYTRSGATISSINPVSSEPPQVFNMNLTARRSGIAISTTISRTYASSYVDPVPATEGYTQYTGYCTLQSNYELRISGNTQYTITVMPTAGTTGNTTWKIGCLTGTSDGGAQFFSAGSNAFESSTYTTTTQERTLTFTSPAGAVRARPYIRIDYDTGTSGVLGTLPRQYTFDYVRFA